jgi:hypothetical protein
MAKFIGKVKESNSMAAGTQMVVDLLHCRTTAQLEHWLTPSRSDHEALESFYTAVVPLVDAFAEGFQGKYGKVDPALFPKGYEFPQGEPLDYFLMVAQFIDETRQMPTFPADSWLQNVVDEIRLLVSQTIYQLRELS